MHNTSERTTCPYKNSHQDSPAEHHTSPASVGPLTPAIYPRSLGYLHSQADAEGKTKPIAQVWDIYGTIEIQPLPPPYIHHTPTITFLWTDPCKGECYRLNFGRKEIFLTSRELDSLTDLLLLHDVRCQNKPTAEEPGAVPGQR